ncbi:hypothetical protein [Burkholderia anthina]|uniref:hypothetical protein n=1 Tax=Burkholderia anthina TaxID=179879 RepID=UPI0037C14798
MMLIETITCERRVQPSPCRTPTASMAATGAEPEVTLHYIEAGRNMRRLLGEAAQGVSRNSFRQPELYDEMPGIFGRPFCSGTLKFRYLGLLDVTSLETERHRFERSPMRMNVYRAGFARRSTRS